MNKILDWDGWEIAGPLVLFIVAIAAVVAMAAAFMHIECDAKTASIGYPARWSLFGDCQIMVTPGQWIPLDNYYFRQGGGQ